MSVTWLTDESIAIALFCFSVVNSLGKWYISADTFRLLPYEQKHWAWQGSGQLRRSTAGLLRVSWGSEQEIPLREVQQMMHGGSNWHKTQRCSLTCFNSQQSKRRGNVGYIMLRSLPTLSYLHPPAVKLVNFNRKCEYHYPRSPLYSRWGVSPLDLSNALS
mgnify:CR=1 FL=1